jgi:hypothetical protein
MLKALDYRIVVGKQVRVTSFMGLQKLEDERERIYDHWLAEQGKKTFEEAMGDSRLRRGLSVKDLAHNAGHGWWQSIRGPSAQLSGPPGRPVRVRNMRSYFFRNQFSPYLVPLKKLLSKRTD